MVKILKTLYTLTLVVLVALSLYTCSSPIEEANTTPKEDTAHSETSVTLSDTQEGFYLVVAGEAVPLIPQHLSNREHIEIAGLPRADGELPVVLVRQGELDLNTLFLRRMVGGIGIDFERDDQAGGMRVNGVRAGFGAETAGLQEGDVILSAEGQMLSDTFVYQNYFDKVGALITGELGSQLSLSVEREGREIEIDVTRDFPTLLSDAYIHYQYVYEEDNVIRLSLEQRLKDGLYCFHSVGSVHKFYCFTVGELAVSRSKPTATSETSAVTSLSTSWTFEYTDCRFPTQPGQDVDCGDLVVPEDRGDVNGRTIRLHIAIFHPPAQPQPDPVIYLHGGPGGGALDWIASEHAHGFQYLFPDRDFIAFDQRGAGYAQPRLDCPGQAGGYVHSLAEDLRMSLLEWGAYRMDGCQADLVAEGVNLAAYTSQASAADLHDLIQALGYEHVNLFGQSYGTYLALTYMQKYAAGGLIRSAVLEGVYPLQVNLFTERAVNAQRAFDAIFATCEADAACNGAYPDLESTFHGLLERLDANPVTVQVANPLTYERQGVVVNSYLLLETLYRASYSTGWIPSLPKMLVDMAREDYEDFISALENVFQISAAVDDGIYYAINCSDEGRFADPATLESANDGLHPLVRAYFDGSVQAMLAVCGDWPMGPADPGQDQVVVSDVPTLLLSGAFDPITPPAWGYLAAQTLSNGYAYEFPAEAHGVMGTSRCAQTITALFVENPIEPGDSCLEDLPNIHFETP